MLTLIIMNKLMGQATDLWGFLAILADFLGEDLHLLLTHVPHQQLQAIHTQQSHTTVQVHTMRMGGKAVNARVIQQNVAANPTPTLHARLLVS